MSELDKITRLINKTFYKGAWYGPSVIEVLQGINQENSNKKLPHTHSIISLVTHMTSWRNYVIKKLNNENDFEVSEALNFPVTTDWLSALEDLYKSQRDLLAAIESFPETRLSELVPNTTYKYTFYTLIHGIIHHDIYHIGQIILIRKSTL
jgi:uncharacterized damage-inducible protein DinB